MEDQLKKVGQTIPLPVAATAMIDTGASGTVIRDDFAVKLGLNPIGTVLINTPSSNNVSCYEYLVRLALPNQIIVETTAIAAPLQGQNIQCLIGRDVLHLAVFIYVGYAGMFSLSI